MSKAAHRVEMTEYFLAKLARMEEFASPHHSVAARAFTASVFTFCYDVLATQPWAYPIFQQSEVVRPEIRRAVFRRTYLLLYRVTDTAIILLEIFHTRQGNIGLPDESNS
jgi:plasmid stabilization system protein ParE